MQTDQVVAMGRLMLQEVVVLTAPILLAAIIASLLLNIFQVLTSLQDQTLSSVPRLLTVGGTIFLLMPWMWRHLAQYTLSLFADLHWVLQ